MTKNRTQVDIIANILSVIAGEPKKTHIMYGANLSYTLLQKYLEKLMKAGLVCYMKDLRVYKLTKKGEAYLKTYAEYEKLRDQSKSNESMLGRKESILNEIVEPSTSTRTRGRPKDNQSECATLQNTSLY